MNKLFRAVTGRDQPFWVWELALEIRIPSVFLAYLIYNNTMHYLNANEVHLPDAKWGMTKGKLLELNKVKYRMNNLPRYGVKYEYSVDGKTYVSTRATTGAPYRNWMSWFYLDTITEAHYLQAIPVLRVGERCTVYYSKENPNLSALASDANSWEMAVLATFVAFPLFAGTSLKQQVFNFWRRFGPAKKMRIRVPSYDFPRPPPEAPPPPTHHSPIPRK